MKRLLPLVAFAAAIFGIVGCGHVDLSPESDPHRVVTGTVNVRMNLLPPPDAEVVVRLLAPAGITAAPSKAAADMVIGERGARERPEQVVAEQVIRGPQAMPVSFRIEFDASDSALRSGLNVEARISWGGHLRFRNVEAQALTLATVASPQTLILDPVQ
jgi:uncharacterized lipoprotein YbaY